MNKFKRRLRLGKPIYKVFTLNIFDIEKGNFYSELFGWYRQRKHACNVVENNVFDMQDGGLFNYAVVVRSYQGAYALNDEILQWYKWNYDIGVWEPCEQPDTSKNLILI